MKQIAIILAGGKGSRLWPLSTENHPKPLLEIFNHKTLMEETVFRAKLFADDIFILTNRNISENTRKHLDSIGFKHGNVIIEPKDADTAAAIAFGLAHIKKLYGQKMTVSLMPVDHRIKNFGAFYRDISFAIKSAQAQKSIVLFGVTPSFPATGYGYIKIGRKIGQEDRDTLFEVDSFHEKPNETKAKEYLNSADHVWNSGLYIGLLDSFEKALATNTSLYEWYKSLSHEGGSKPMPKEFSDFQFEQGIIEGLDKLQTVIATFDWADIGTYDELYATALQTDDRGNAIKANAIIEDCENCLIIGQGKKIVALGLEDIAIVDSPDGILVCRKSTHSQIVGQIATGESQPSNLDG